MVNSGLEVEEIERAMDPIASYLVDRGRPLTSQTWNSSSKADCRSGSLSAILKCLSSLSAVDNGLIRGLGWVFPINHSGDPPF